MDEFSGLRYIVSILLLWIIFRKTDSTCTLPASLVSDWNDVTKSATVTFTSTQLIRWNLTVAGELKYSHTCISNTGNVYVFRGDAKYNELVDKNYYICMKLTQVSSNLYYYYLLADPNSKANNARIYTPNSDPISSTPTCDYCSYSNTIPDNSYYLLQKTGTSETPTTAPSLCLPCASDCSTTTPPQSTGSQQTPPQSTGSQQDSSQTDSSDRNRLFSDEVIKTALAASFGGLLFGVAVVTLGLFIIFRTIRQKSANSCRRGTVALCQNSSQKTL